MSEEKRILLVDDDLDILELLQYNLEKGGFTVRTVNRSEKAFSCAENFLPNLIILDLMMPEIDGLKLCQQLRLNPKFNDVYIFFLTAKSGSSFQDIALNRGADDYIEKMMGIRSLMSKVDSVLRKNLTIRKRANHLMIKNLKIDRDTYSVYVNNSLVDLNLTEFEILYFFAQNAGKNIHLDTIVENLSNTEIYLIESTARLHLMNLQKKMGSGIICGSDRMGFRLGLVDPLL